MATEEHKYVILYVDDEQQSLKWFAKAFDTDYRILTASSVDEALGMLEKGIDDLALVMTDQRMPNKTGVDLLAILKQKYSRSIRILTTAYSDMNSAIDAINTGAIYRYVVKPWNIKELRTILRQAVDLFVLQREREMLMREKLSVLQRIIIADRVQSLAVFATGLAHHIRNSMTALMYFLDLTPTRIQDEVANEALKHPEFWTDIWSMAVQQSHRILKIVSAVGENVVQPANKFDTKVEIAELLRLGAVRCKVKDVNLVCDANVKPLNVSMEMGVKLVAILLNRVQSGDSGECAEVTANALPDVWGTPGIRLHISGKGPGWDPEKLIGLFTPFCQIDGNPQDLGLDLLSAFFICYHHGGDLSVQCAPEPPGFVLQLPYDPALVRRPSLESDCLEKMFTRFSAQEMF